MLAALNALYLGHFERIQPRRDITHHRDLKSTQRLQIGFAKEIERSPSVEMVPNLLPGLALGLPATDGGYRVPAAGDGAACCSGGCGVGAHTAHGAASL